MMEAEKQIDERLLAEHLEFFRSFPLDIAAAKELLRRLHARNQELEAMLEAVGAGGVSAQRVTQGKDHIAQDRKMAPVTVVLPEPVAVQIRYIKEERWRTIALVLYDLYAGDEYERRYIYTEQQVRELLAKDLDAVNLDRLGKALTKLGHATWVSQEAAAADIPRWVNALTSCVLEIPEAAPQPQADARDAERLDFLTRNIGGAAFRKIGVEWAEHADARRAIDAAIAAAKENK
jgi:hypothetical protein